MKIYDEISHEEITSPDLSAGYVYDDYIVTDLIPEHVSFVLKNGSTKSDDSYALPGTPVIQNPRSFDDMSSFGALKLEAKTGQSNAKFTALTNLICVYGTTKDTNYNLGKQFVLNSGFYGFAKT